MSTPDHDQPAPGAPHGPGHLSEPPAQHPVPPQHPTWPEPPAPHLYAPQTQPPQPFAGPVPPPQTQAGYPAHYGARGDSAPSSAGPRNVAAILATALAGALLLWELIQGGLGQAILRSGDYDAYQVVYGVGGFVTAALAIAALAFGIVGLVRKGVGQKALAGVGLGVGAYVLVLSLFWFVIGILPY